jgi:uncharacterized membrane protein YgcG
VPAGELTAKQRERIAQAIRLAEDGAPGTRFSVYIGDLPADSRRHAERMLAALGDVAEDSVLIAVDPEHRTLEIVTGAQARRRLDDRGCALAAATMTSQFQVGNLVGGVTDGLAALEAHTRR